jgi:hypothetical protein
MRKMILGSAMVAAIMAVAAPAQASIYSDELSKCLVEKTTPKDKQMFVQWVFTAMSANPTVASMSKVTAADRESYSRSAAQLMQRLLTVDCRDKLIAAIKADGVGTIEQSFGLLGEVAMREFMSEPTVNAVFASLDTYIDKDKLNALLLESGIPVPPKH